MITRHRFGMCGIIFALIACRTASSPTLAVAPCAGPVVIYAYGDTAHGVHAPRPTHVILPKPSGDLGTAVVRLLVTPEGTVLGDSSRVIQTSNADWGREALAAAVQTTFKPATRDGCAVYFWYDITTSNQD